jgi:hypothetical protein
MVKGGGFNCDFCKLTYSGNPPCGTDICEAPPLELSYTNRLSWELWLIASNYGRGDGEGFFPIKASEVLSLCEAYDASLDDFEKILYVEENIRPYLEEKFLRQLREKTKHA